MNETKMQTLVGRHLKKYYKKSAAFELKITKTNRFYLRNIAPHQWKNLKLAHSGLFYHKIPDLGLQNPFDCFTLYKVPAYVVILYYVPRKLKECFVIPVNKLAKVEAKSITAEEARQLAELIINI